MNHTQTHPMQIVVDRAWGSSKIAQNIAILSPLVERSFVFHLALALLERCSDDNPHCIVTVIGSSQSAFKQALIEENDMCLMSRPSNSKLANLLDRIEFRFCTDLHQLLALLYELGRPTTDPSGPRLDSVEQGSQRIGLIISDLTSYSTFLSNPTLSDLTRLLGFLHTTQSRLASVNQLEYMPIFLFDRISPTESWPLLDTSSSNDVKSVLKIFQHFFHQTWNIEGPASGDSGYGEVRKYRLYSSSTQRSSAQQIVYEVVEETLSEGLSIGVNDMFRRTTVVEGS